MRVPEETADRPALEVVAEPEATEEGLAPVISLSDRAGDSEVIDDDSTDVDALFARLRAEHTENEGGAAGESSNGASSKTEGAPAGSEPDVDVVVVETVTVTETIEVDLTTVEPKVGARADTEADELRAEDEDEDGDEADPEAEVVEELTGDARIIAARDAGIEPSIVPLARGIKRRLQDEQNEVLDAIRKQKRKLSVEKSVPELDEHRAAWMAVLEGPVTEAFRTGASSVGSTVSELPDDLVPHLAEWVMLPLRERIEATIAESIAPGADLDTSDLPARVGARYREFRNQDLDPAVLEVLGAAYARGVAAGVPEGTVLRWIPTTPGTCSDCDDNVLEPTVVGQSFPTGQAWPPAHPGCRCALAPADDADDHAFAGANHVSK